MGAGAVRVVVHGIRKGICTEHPCTFASVPVPGISTKLLMSPDGSMASQEPACMTLFLITTLWQLHFYPQQGP